MRPPTREPAFTDVSAAWDRIAVHVHRTPVLTSHTLDAECGLRLFFKCENLQRAGVFKARGAHNAVMALSDEEARRGVLTHSSGNHGAALALAAATRGIRAHIVVPENAPALKVEAIRRYGGLITFCNPTLADREATADRIAAETGATLIHPYDNTDVIAGQGTVALEFLAEASGLDVIIAPVGGGGLLSGIAIAAKGLKPGIRVIGAEPSGADDAARSLKAGFLIPQTDPKTIADGLRTSLAPVTFSILRRHAEEIITVSEPAIIEAMRQLWSVLKIVVEPSSAVAFAAALAAAPRLRGLRIGVVLSGGNVDPKSVPWEKP